MISENGEGEKVTVVDVDEEVVFLKIEKQEDEKGNLGGRNGGAGATGGNGDKEKRIMMKTGRRSYYTVYSLGAVLS